jgi:hypothetical protein
MGHNVRLMFLTLTHNYTIHFQHIFDNNFTCKNIFELHNHTKINDYKTLGNYYFSFYKLQRFHQVIIQMNIIICI